MDKFDTLNENHEYLSKTLMDLESFLKDINNKQHDEHTTDSNFNDLLHLSEKIVAAQKDIDVLKEKFEETKTSLKSIDDLKGSVNQLKMIIDELKNFHKVEKENKTNFFWQLVIPILLAIIFFLSGLFFKSVSSIHKSNISSNDKKPKPSYEYRNFE